MGAALGPSHLLSLDKSLTQNLVDGRLNKGRGNGFSMPITVAVIGNKGSVGANVGSVATLQSPGDRLAGCSSWHLRFAVYSSGGNLSRRSSCWRWDGTCAFPCRTATSKSCSPSGVCTPTTSRCGDGFKRYAPELQRCLRRHLKPTNDSWRMDETYVRVKGKWRYLYRAVDSTGATLDFLLSAKQDAVAAKRFLVKALGGANHPAPRVINTDEHAAYPPAVAQLKAEGDLTEDCRHRPVQYLNNVLEQDHRPIKRRGNARQHFRSFCGARRTLAGYEAIHMIRKGQASGSPSAPGIGLLHRFILGLFAATS